MAILFSTLMFGALMLVAGRALLREVRRPLAMPTLQDMMLLDAGEPMLRRVPATAAQRAAVASAPARARFARA